MKKPLIILLISIAVIAILLGAIFLITRLQPAEEIIPAMSSDGFFNPQLISLRDKIETTDDPSIGPVGAPITIVEFMDFRCPFCTQSFPIIRELGFLYPQDVKIILRDFPIVAEDSFQLALAGNCAHEQGKFWELHDKLYQFKNEVTLDTLGKYALAAGLEMAKFKNCLSTEKYKSEIFGDIADANELGVQGTPTWFINGYRFGGVISLKQFKEIVEGVLERMR